MNKEKVLCVYHNRDLDGWASAAIVKDTYPSTTFLGWDYGMDVPENIYLAIWDKIFLVDISFDPETMKDIARDPRVIWIDHHPSAVKDAEEHGYGGMNGLRDTVYAACELTWGYTHSTPMPDGIYLAGMYDSFRHKTQSLQFQERVMNFQYAARTNITGPKKAAILLALHTEPWIDAGSWIFKYLKVEAKSIFKQAFPVEILGHKGMMVNAVRFNPANFEIEYDEEFFGCFHFTGKRWVASLYSDGKVDCSVICKELGGGGHAGAAGFQRDEFNDLEQIFNS